MERFFKVTILSALYTFIKMMLGFVVSKIIAIYTGPAGIAMLGQLQSWINITVGISTAPVGNGLVRFTAENWSKGHEECAPWWSACLRVAIIIVSIIIPSSILTSKQLSLMLFNDPHYYWLIVFAVCVLPLSIANILIASVINGQQKYHQYIFLGMLSVTISTLVMIVLVMSFGLEGALISAVLYTSIAGLVLIFSCLNNTWFKIKYWFSSFDKNQLTQVGSYSIMALVTAVSMPTSLLFVRKLLLNETGWEHAGHWQAVWKISEVYLGVITIALSTYLLPRLATLKYIKLMRAELNLLSPYILSVTIFLALIVYFLRDIAISVLFTKDFYEARNLFLYQLIGDVLKISGFLYAYPLIALGRTKVFISVEIISSIVLFILCYFFIPNFGVQGANIGYLLCYFIYFAFMFTFTNFIKDDRES